MEHVKSAGVWLFKRTNQFTVFICFKLGLIIFVLTLTDFDDLFSRLYFAVNKEITLATQKPTK